MALLVTGAPGSGLPAVAEALARLDPGRVRVPDADASRACELDEVDAAVLAEAGGRWSAPPAPDAPLGNEDLVRWGRAAVARVAADEGWVWCAPSLSLTLPFWREVLAGEPAVVVVLRDPEAAAGALAAEGLSAAYARALGERCVRSVVAADGLDVAVVRYEELAGSLSEIADLAGMAPEPDDLAAAAEALASDAAAAPAGDDAPVFAAVAELVGTHRPFRSPALPDEVPGVQLGFDEHARLVTGERSERERAQEHEIARLRAEVTGLADEVEGRTQEIGRLSKDLEYMTDRAEDMERRALGFYHLPPVRAYTWLMGKVGRST